MKNRTRFGFLTLVLVTMAVWMSGCVALKTDEELIRDRVDAFIFAYNSGDIEGAFECFDAKSQHTYSAMLNIGNDLFGDITGLGLDISDLFALAVGTSDGDLLSAEIDRVVITDETHATVTLRAAFTDARLDVSESAEDLTLHMIKEGNDWFINGQEDLF